MPASGERYTIEGHADAVAGFLAANDLRDVVLVGNSMGGVVCQMAAIRHPERLSRLVLVSTEPYTADPAAALAAADREEEQVWDRAAAADYVNHFFVSYRRIWSRTSRRRSSAPAGAASTLGAPRPGRICVRTCPASAFRR